MLSFHSDVYAHWNGGAFVLKPLPMDTNKEEETTGKRMRVQVIWQPSYRQTHPRTVSLTDKPDLAYVDQCNGYGPSWNVYKNGSESHVIAKQIRIQTGDVLEITTPAPERLPLPSRDLLEMQCKLHAVHGTANVVAGATGAIGDAAGALEGLILTGIEGLVPFLPEIIPALVPELLPAIFPELIPALVAALIPDLIPGLAAGLVPGLFFPLGFPLPKSDSIAQGRPSTSNNPEDACTTTETATRITYYVSYGTDTSGSTIATMTLSSYSSQVTGCTSTGTVATRTTVAGYRYCTAGCLGCNLRRSIATASGAAASLDSMAVKHKIGNLFHLAQNSTMIARDIPNTWEDDGVPTCSKTWKRQITLS